MESGAVDRGKEINMGEMAEGCSRGGSEAERGRGLLKKTRRALLCVAGSRIFLASLKRRAHTQGAVACRSRERNRAEGEKEKQSWREKEKQRDWTMSTAATLCSDHLL
jgi:hypothetical protein